MRALAVQPVAKHLRRRPGPVQAPPIHRDEPKELDSDNEAVAQMHEGIRRILSKAKPQPRTSLTVPDDEKHVLHCSKILKLDVERRIVNIIVEKSDGGLRQVRIEASDD
jgi:hypothetical protein